MVDLIVEGELIAPRINPALIDHKAAEATLRAAWDSGKLPHAWLITVSAAQFGFGEALSPEVEAAMPEVVERVCALVSAETDIPTMPCAS